MRSLACSGGVTPVMRSGLSVYQTSHDLLCQVLRKILVDVVQAGRGTAGGIGSVECQAVATLYMLLMDHPIDRRGRVGLAAALGRCLGRDGVAAGHGKASVWLHQPDAELLLHLLVQELGLAASARPVTGVSPGRVPTSDPDDTDVLPAIAADQFTESSQTPAVPRPPTAVVGRPDLARGGPGDDPDGRGSRRVPPDSSPPRHSGRPLLLAGGMT